MAHIPDIPDDPSNPQNAQCINRAFLFQKPKKWTSKHLEMTRVKLTEHTTTEQLLGSKYATPDNDTDFETLIQDLCARTRKQIEQDNVEDYGKPCSGVIQIFQDLSMLTQNVTEMSRSVFPKMILQRIVMEVLLRSKAGSKLVFVMHGNVPFEVPQLGFKAGVQGGGIVTASNKDIPLAVLSIINKPGPNAMAKYEVPPSLIPSWYNPRP